MKYFAVLLLSFIIFSCGTKTTIKGTTIENNKQNKEVVDFVLYYNTLLEKKDVSGLFNIASKDFYDNGGTTTTEDDFSYSQLKDVLDKRFKNIKEIKQIVFIKSIIFEDDKIFVTYDFDGRFLMSVDGKDEWRTKKDINQLELIKTDKSYKIVKGM